MPFLRVFSGTRCQTHVKATALLHLFFISRRYARGRELTLPCICGRSVPRILAETNEALDQRKGRRITLTPTPKGTQMMQQLQESIHARVPENLKRLPPSDPRRIPVGMQLLRNLFREEEGKDAC
jgi:hypothetical protein